MSILTSIEVGLLLTSLLCRDFLGWIKTQKKLERYYWRAMYRIATVTYIRLAITIHLDGNALFCSGF